MKHTSCDNILQSDHKRGWFSTETVADPGSLAAQCKLTRHRVKRLEIRVRGPRHRTVSVHLVPEPALVRGRGTLCMCFVCACACRCMHVHVLQIVCMRMCIRAAAATLQARTGHHDREKERKSKTSSKQERARAVPKAGLFPSLFQDAG